MTAATMDLGAGGATGSQYLVTTSHALLLVDTASAVSREVHTGSGLYYGIATDGGRYFVGARRRMNADPEPPGGERGCILVFDRQLELLETWESPSPMRDIHQILWWRASLWVTCSHDNSVAIREVAGWRTWYPLGMPDAPPLDRNHFNSLTPFAAELVVVATNRGASELLFFDAESLQLNRRLPLGVHAHNAWRQGGEWLTCSSGEGRILGSDGFCVQTGKFPRGVGFGPDEIVVGISEVAERNDRDLTDGALYIYSGTWEFRRAMSFRRSGLVLDVLPVDEPA